MKKAVIAVLTGVMLMATAGCTPQETKAPSGDSAPAASSSTPAASQTPKSSAASGTQKEQVKTLKIEVYYPNEDGTKLVGVSREIEVSSLKDKYTAAVEMQMRAPKEKDLVDIFPKSARLRSVTLKGETAVVDLDGSTVRTFVGGSTGEEMLVGSVVNTLTNFPEVKEVRFLVDGNPVETLAGHMDLTMPIKRMKGLIK